MNNESSIYSYELDDAGQAKEIDWREEHNIAPKNGYVWYHMPALQQETRAFLENKTDIEPIIIDALMAPETRPRALIKEDGMLIILRAMNLNIDEDPEDMISIRIWMDENKVITTRCRNIKAIDDIIKSIDEGKAPNSPGYFLTMITDRLFYRMEPFLIDLEERIAETEEYVAYGNYEDISEDAALVRKRTTVFTRYITPQKTLLETILKADFDWLEEQHKEHLVESLDQVTRYVEELHELRDRSHIINDELNNLHGRRLNDITYIFSVAATIFLPLSFLTGLMGINIGGMPGVGSDNAFWVFGGLCASIVIVQVLLFKKLKWF